VGEEEEEEEEEDPSSVKDRSREERYKTWLQICNSLFPFVTTFQEARAEDSRIGDDVVQSITG